MKQLSIQINSMEDAVRGIEAAQKKACTAFIEIGYILRRANDAELYKEKGYSSIFIFAEKEYGWDQSQTSRFMNINREYSEGGYSCTLQEKYEGYGKEKLAEMLKLPDRIREEITPEMKRDDIRELKKDYQAAEETRQEEQFQEAFAPAQQEEPLLRKTARALLENNTYAERLVDLWPLMLEHREGEAVNEMDILMALAPGGYGHARIQSCMCFFRKEEMSILHGRDKERHSYTELLNAIVSLSEAAEFDSPENWYRTVFGKELPQENKEKTTENNENPKGEQASGNPENQPEKPPHAMPEKDQKYTINTGGIQKQDESGTNSPAETAEKEENNENPKGEQPLEGQTEISDFAEKMAITYEKLPEKDTEEAVFHPIPFPEPPQPTSENNENSKGGQPFRELPDTAKEQCQYCCGNKMIKSSNGKYFIRRAYTGWAIGETKKQSGRAQIQFKYCPICGRELKE